MLNQMARRPLCEHGHHFPVHVLRDQFRVSSVLIPERGVTPLVLLLLILACAGLLLDQIKLNFVQRYLLILRCWLRFAILISLPRRLLATHVLVVLI